jgi:hypothetical protein
MITQPWFSYDQLIIGSKGAALISVWLKEQYSKALEIEERLQEHEKEKEDYNHKMIAEKIDENYVK